MSNTIPEIKQTTIHIGALEYEGYKGPNGYYLNLSQVGSLINKPARSAFAFFQSKTFKTLYQKGFTTFAFSRPQGGKAVLIETPAVVIYVGHWTKKGSPEALKLALELMQQNLDIRIENALGPIEAEKVAELTEQEPDWLKARKSLKRSHAAFQKACQYDHYPAWDVHDAITVLVTGLTAKEARELLPVVSGEASVGLNHQTSVEDLERIREMKVLFTTYRKGSWQEKVNRAYTESTHCG